jgi:site-specific recombinase XerD
VAEYLSDWRASFLLALQGDHKAPRTVELYSRSLELFEQWLTARDRAPVLDELTRSAVRAWLAELAAAAEPATVRLRFAAMRRFCRWLVAEGELATNPMEGMAGPVVKAKPVPLLDDEQLAALVKACAGRDFTSRRDEAVIRFLLDTGCRASELLGLTGDDVHLQAGSAMVTGKGRRTRAVYFSARTAAALDRYLRERRRHAKAHLPAFWLSQRGPLSMAGLQHILKVRSQAAGVEGVHAHRFRHSFAHDWLANGGQERDLMRIAGWTDPAMLARYGAAAADVRARDAAKRLRRGDRI